MRITVSDCLAFVSARYLISRENIIGKCRMPHTIKARHLAIALASELTDASTAVIGKRFNRNHSTVIYAARIAAARYPEELQELKQQFIATKEVAE